MIPAVFCAAQSEDMAETFFEFEPEPGQEYTGGLEAEPEPPGAPRPGQRFTPPVATAASMTDTTIRVTVTVNGQEKTIEFPLTESRPAGIQANAGAGARRPESPAVRSSIKVTPKMPDSRSGRTYRIQVGAFSRTVFARRAFDRLLDAGFSPAYERHGQYYRVVVAGVRAADMAQAVRRLESAGFSEAWLREEF
jgi:cell division protein FtsN